MQPWGMLGTGGGRIRRRGMGAPLEDLRSIKEAWFVMGDRMCWRVSELPSCGMVESVMEAVY